MKKTSGAKRSFRNGWILLLLGAALFLLQYFYQIFDRPLQDLNRYLTRLNGLVSEQLITGISIGTALFILLLLIYPLITRKINTRSYYKNVYQGILSSLIFLSSQAIYGYFEKIGRFQLLLSILVITLVTMCLIHLTAKMFKNKEDGIEFRTGYIASITAGLIFGVLSQLFMLGLNVLKTQDIAGISRFLVK